MKNRARRLPPWPAHDPAIEPVRLNMPSAHCITKPFPSAKFGIHVKYVQNATSGAQMRDPTQKL